MRRALSIFVALFLGLPLLAPLLSPLLGSTPEGALPACCRRNGAHHCMGAGMAVPSPLPAVGAKCPSYPKAAATLVLRSASMGPAQSTLAVIVAHPTGQPQTEARYRVASSRSRHKRGPPSLLV